jgi:hypothetical protein
MPREALLAALVMSLLLTSTFISLVNLAQNDKFPTDLFGTNAESIEGSLQYQSGNPPGSTFNEINYSISNGFDPNTSRIIKGHWYQDDLGMHTQYDETSIVILDNIRPTGSVYVVKYTVNNSFENPYFLLPRFTNQMSLFGQTGGETQNDLRVIFDSTGVHIKKYPLGIFNSDQGDYFFYPSPGIQTTISGGSIITTTLVNKESSYVTEESTLTINKDGIDLFTTHVRDGFLSYGYFYGGYGSDSAGFNMCKINANFAVNQQSSDTHYLTFIDALVGGLINWFKAVAEFFGSLYTFLRYSVDSSLCPLWLSSLIIVPQLVAIGYIIAELARGD